MLCSTLPVIARPPQPTIKTKGQCGEWITLCGRGKHSVHYNLGKMQAPINIWYVRETPDDELYVHQNGEVIAAAPLNDPKGSFSFQYAPLDGKPGNDEIIITHEGKTNEGLVRLRLDCPVDPCLPEVVVKPPMKETVTHCGRQWHQAGYVKKNTIVLGPEAGYVTVIWEVIGVAEVVFFQDRSVLKTITSNRNGEFSFYYDPALGEVYARTQGTGSVSYIFTCPFTPVDPEIPVYEFTCDSDEPYAYEAPRDVEIKLPVKIGTIDIEVTLVETVHVEFRQNNVPFYVLSGHTGTVSFSYDYDPDKGKVTVYTTGYGPISVKVKCPYTPPDPDPTHVDAYCGNILNTFPGYSIITVDMGGISGRAICDFSITETEVIVEHTTSQTITGSTSFELEYDKTVPLIIRSKGNDFRMRISCPIAEPIDEILDCGTEKTIDSFANVTVRYGTTPGNTTITTNLDVNVYRDGVLVGMGKSVTFFYGGSNTVTVVSATRDQQLTISATCPALDQLACGPDLQDYNGGDTVVVQFLSPSIRGHVQIRAVIVGTVSLVFRVGNVNTKTITASENFELIMRTGDGLRVVSTGSGTFQLAVECATPIVVVNTEHKTERVDCPAGQTSGGVVGGDPFVTASWDVLTWSDGAITQTAKVYDGVCKLPEEAPIPPIRWGVGMLANRNFTGGTLPEDITEEMATDYCVSSVYSPGDIPCTNAAPYEHWTGVDDFVAKVMTNTLVPTDTDYSPISANIPTGKFMYYMWDGRIPDLAYIDLQNNFELVMEGANWFTDWYQNESGLPGHNPNLPRIKSFMYDDGTGLREWKMHMDYTPTLSYQDMRLMRVGIKIKR